LNMSGSFCHHGPGGCNDSCYICLAPLGPGQADDAQIANALLTGAVVCLAPGDWLINGAVVTYTQAQELHGPAPADDGTIRLSYSDAITLESSDATGRYALNTFDANFGGVIDHTMRLGFNNGASGNAEDPALIQWALQFESEYLNPIPGTLQSEWFLQWRPGGGGVVELRPIQCNVVWPTQECNTTIRGTFTIRTDADGQPPRLAVPGDANPIVTTGQVSFMDTTGATPIVTVADWSFLVTVGQIYANGTAFQINWAAQDFGHGVNPAPFYITASNNSHPDTPITNTVEFNNPTTKPSLTVAQLNAAPLALAKARAGTEAFCTDETGGAVPVFSDGTNWRRVTDRAIIS
jgi:hypothetical protein